MIPHKCVIGEPRFSLYWRDIGAEDSCMFTIEICLDWSLPHYEDCGWYLDCPKDACPSSEKTIRHKMMKKKQILVILQFCKYKMCSSNLESLNQKRQKVVKKTLVHENKYNVTRKFHNMKNCLFFPMIWIRIHSEAKV